MSIANVRKGRKCRLSVVAAELGDRVAHILLLAHGLDIGRILVRVDRAEETAWGRRNGELSERKEGRYEDRFGEHCGVVGEFVEVRCYVSFRGARFKQATARAIV